MSKKLKMIDLFASFSCQPFSLAGVAKIKVWKRQTVFGIEYKGICFLKLQEFLKISDLNVLCSKMPKIYNILQKNMQLVYDSARRQEYGGWNYT